MLRHPCRGFIKDPQCYHLFKYIFTGCRAFVKQLRHRVRNLKNLLKKQQEQSPDVSVNVRELPLPSTESYVSRTHYASAATISSTGNLRFAPGHNIHTQSDSHVMHALKQRFRKQEMIEEAEEALKYLSNNLNASLWARLRKLCGFATTTWSRMGSVEPSQGNPHTFLGEQLANHLRANPFLRGFDVCS
jgi:hypothetical protein